MHKKAQGIIFDMDNTVLCSAIDFPLMKRRVMEILDFYGIGYNPLFSVSPLINSANMPKPVAKVVWEEVLRLELEGIHGACLEPGIREALLELKERFVLTLLTNNTQAAAELALSNNSLELFELVVGRDIAPAMKPSAEGILFIKHKFPEVSRWLAVGDALIDAQAAKAAGIPFVAFNADRQEDWQAHGIEPALSLVRWDKFACIQIKTLGKSLLNPAPADK